MKEVIMRVTFGNFNYFDSFRNYFLVALQQGRPQLDSEANQGQRIALQPSRLSLGVAASKYRFESPKAETWIFVLYNRLRR
jgi:hypothetical protein